MATTKLSQACREAALSGMEIAAVAELVPERPAIFYQGQSPVTFYTLNQRSNQLARLLLEAGFKAGDKMILLSHNTVEFVEVRWAIHRLGGILVPINWHLETEDIIYIVNDSQARFMAADVRFSDCAAQCNHSGLQLMLGINGSIEGAENYQQCRDAQSGEDISHPQRGDIMFYTSGTTGKPKGVYRPPMESEKSVVMQSFLTDVFDFRPEEGKDCALAIGPLYHSGPLGLCLSTPHTSGIPIVLIEKWDAERMLQDIEHYRITHTFCVPTLFHRLLALPEETRNRYDISSLRFVIHGAAPCPVATKHAMIDWFGPIFTELMASTEGGGTMISSEEWLKHPGAVGKPDPSSIKILDDQGSPLSAGEEGYIYWRMDAPFEYFNAPEKTTKSRHGDYFTAGDMGKLDEQGYLYISGRSAEIIISGGVNIYPAEIDHVLLNHPKVADVACVGVPDEEWGEAVKAVVCLKDNVAVSKELEEELISYCRQHMAHFRAPKSVDFTTAIPRSEAGKIYRDRIRRGYWKNRDKAV